MSNKYSESKNSNTNQDKDQCKKENQETNDQNKSNNHDSKFCKDGKSTREDLVFCVTNLAFTIARSLSKKQLQTLINLVDVFNDTLIAVIAQRNIDCNEKSGVIPQVRPLIRPEEPRLPVVARPKNPKPRR